MGNNEPLDCKCISHPIVTGMCVTSLRNFVKFSNCMAYMFTHA